MYNKRNRAGFSGSLQKGMIIFHTVFSSQNTIHLGQ